MSSIKTFFRTLFKSSTDPEYYQDVLQAPARFSWKYFFVFNLLAALVTGISILVPLSLLDVPALIRSVTELYPSDLEVGVSDQGLTTNQELPYSIPFPDNQPSEAPKNLVVFADENQISSLQDVQDQDAVIVFTQKELYFLEDDGYGQYQAYALPEFEENWSINRATVDSLTDTLINNPFVQQKMYVPLIGVVLLITLYPLTLLMRVIVLAIFSFITWVLVMLFMKDKGLSYTQIFKISIHSLTPVIIIAYILGVAGWIFFHGGPYLLAYLAWTLFVISKLPSLTAAPVEAQPVAALKTKATPRRATRKPKKTTTKKTRSVSA